MDCNFVYKRLKTVNLYTKMGEDGHYQLLQRLYGKSTADIYLGKVKAGAKGLTAMLDAVLTLDQRSVIDPLNDAFDSYLPRDAIRFDPSKVNAAGSLA
jgi:hypothetical protein